MTMTLLLIALVAGAASAVMFASIASGAVLSLLLFYLAPLPLMVVGLSWGPLVALIGAVAACIGIGVFFSFSYIAAFGLTVGMPAWWLARQALLGRPASQTSAELPADVAKAQAEAQSPGAIEWYPVGRLVLWAAVFAVLTTASALFTLGSDEASITATLKQGLTRIMGIRADSPVSPETDRVLDALVGVAPAAGAAIALLTLTINLWLAGKIAATSGRLQRPWPVLRMFDLPPMTLAALSLAIALAFMGGLLGIIAQIVTAALMGAYALVGFATLHVVTMALKGRMLWLSSVYAGVLVFGWPIVLMIALGLTDAILGLRQRYLRRQSVPTIHS